VSSDIFGGQPSDPDQLAELYDLEHDEVIEDIAFYRELARRNHGGAVLDLGCGSGRLFASLLAGGTRRLVGVDGSAALIRRARQRIAAVPELAAADAQGRVVLLQADIRHLEQERIRDALGGARASLVVAAGVLPHLDGPEEALSMLTGLRSLLAPRGTAVLDDIGPGLLPTRDLPLSVDWRRVVNGREVVRRSQLTVRQAPEGLRVVFGTLVDVGQPDGTIARLPASHRLWYPLDEALAALVGKAGMVVELTYGSHDLDALVADSDRRIFLVRRAAGRSGEPPNRRGR
jgi:SAM-dependent methyltransferase